MQEEYDLKLQRIEAFDEEIETLQNQRADALKSLDLFAQALSIKRKSIGEYMKSELVNKLVSLGIKNAQIEIMFEQIPYSPNGIDKVVFLFSANKNSALNPIASIASGGEIARVMLGLKSLIVSRSALPTIIFDEIDTGVSGEIAHRMGEMMREMSANMQVITITHLPQIAAKGKGHLKVYKSDSDVSTETHLIVLKPEERVQEIAEMLSGKNPTEASLLTAQELLK